MKTPLTFAKYKQVSPALFLLLSYLIIGFLNLSFSHFPAGNFAAIWFAAGIGLIMMLEMGALGIPLVLIASFMLKTPLYYLHLTSTQQPDALTLALTLGLLSAATDALQSVMSTKAWTVFIQKAHRRPLKKPSDLPYFWLYICFMPTLLSTGLWYLLLSLAHSLFDSLPIISIKQLMLIIMGNTAGLFVIAPVYASWKSGDLKYNFRPALPYLLALCLIIAAGFLVYSYLLMLILPVLLLIAIHFRLAGTSLALLIAFTLSMLGTALHTGPFTHIDDILSVFNLQLFLFAIGLTLHYLALLQELLSQSQLKLETEVASRTEALAAANKRLEELVTTDELTGVANRREWQRRCEEAITYARRYQQPLSVLMIDIDHFKNVNDRYGHLAGDLTLKELCRVCTAELRASDCFARWGGEEFVLLLPGTSRAEAISTGNKLRIAVEQLAVVHFQEHTIKITISIGVAMLEENDKRLDHLLNRADQAMYAAKAGGRNQVR